MAWYAIELSEDEISRFDEYIEILKKRPFAHRGYFNKEEGIPENSIPAFERAIKSGFGIELDVHILKDGTIMKTGTLDLAFEVDKNGYEMIGND